MGEIPSFKRKEGFIIPTLKIIETDIDYDAPNSKADWVETISFEDTEIHKYIGYVKIEHTVMEVPKLIKVSLNQDFPKLMYENAILDFLVEAHDNILIATPCSNILQDTIDRWDVTLSCKNIPEVDGIVHCAVV